VRRREFITMLGGAAAASPFAARAQQSAMPVIGFLGSASLDAVADFLPAFRRGLSETGYVEGQNVAIDYRWAQGQYDRLPELAAELIRRQVAIIVAIGPPAAQVAKAAITTIPVVFGHGADPVKLGLVSSLNRPGGNVTGVSFLVNALGAKRLELLREVAPKASVIAVLVNPNNASAEADTREVQEAARILQLQLHILNASNGRDVDIAFATLVEQQISGLVVNSDLFFRSQRDHLAALAARHTLPAIYSDRGFVAAGGLMSYGTSLADGYRQVGIYTGKILKGAKPADLPVMQSVKFELVINLKTAKALGIEVPATVLARADEVIE
jgi:putative tryptophan/tyrosine transport system substrate-binding protein